MILGNIQATTIRSITLLTALSAYAPAGASVKDDIGYTQLQAELGAAIPMGSASVFQIEADIPQGSNSWLVDDSDPEFVGKTIVDLSDSAPSASGVTSHATTVGKKFYGSTSSISPGIDDIGVYSVNGWLIDQTAPGGNYNTVTFSFVGVPVATDRRIANHSWVGNGLTDVSGNDLPLLTASWLKHNDWFSDKDELIQIYGTSNSGSGAVLMATSYNGIVAGITEGTSGNQVVALDNIYVANRAAIHIVTPEVNSSGSAPIVASAAALLIDAASSNSGWSESSTNNRNGTLIYNAERTETIKAALMAGALRETSNTTELGDILDYREDPANQTDNGLDWRFGAGQLNIYNSYQILASGEKASLEDGGALNIGYTGFDHDAEFGGLTGTNTVATYDLGTTSQSINISIALAWHLRNYTSSSASTFNESSVLYNLDVQLIDVTNGNTVVAQSNSAIDNTENIWHTLDPYTKYQIRVQPGDGQGAFNWDYSIAWFNTAAPNSFKVPLHEWTYFFLAGTLLLVHRKSGKNHSIS